MSDFDKTMNNSRYSHIDMWETLLYFFIFGCCAFKVKCFMLQGQQTTIPLGWQTAACWCIWLLLI